MTLAEFFEDLSQRFHDLNLPEPMAHDIVSFRPSVLQSHFDNLIKHWHLIGNQSSNRSSWNMIKEHVPKELWSKYEHDEDLRRSLKEWQDGLK